ncbi:hypothetical protein SAMN05421736_101143 [Evansella caseinilytica]|uniref:Uncharacterized protein n=1 Tax=Evansella caseinilytica TaxID=1503961 RepID=A0A1H3GGT0_9BACI|nr:hypothetical protein SAMN05421736_101143 [Evansella caseinilytica]
MRATATFGFINDNATHYVKGNVKEKWHRFSTTHPNMPGYAWHQF